MIDYDGEKLTLDGTNYFRDDYEGDQRVLFDSIVYSLSKVRHVSNELAIYDTARMAYKSALLRELQTDE